MKAPYVPFDSCLQPDRAKYFMSDDAEQYFLVGNPINRCSILAFNTCSWLVCAAVIIWIRLRVRQHLLATSFSSVAGWVLVTWSLLCYLFNWETWQQSWSLGTFHRLCSHCVHCFGIFSFVNWMLIKWQYSTTYQHTNESTCGCKRSKTCIVVCSYIFAWWHIQCK